MSSEPADRKPKPKDFGWLRRSGQVGLMLALGATILPHGATSESEMLSGMVIVGLAATAGAISTARRPAHESFANEVLVFASILAIYVLFQAVSFDGNPFANEIWFKAESLLGSTTFAISVDSSSTYAALFPLLMPIFAFYSVIQLFDDDDSAQGLIKFLALFGLVFGLHGILQMLFFPEGLLIRSRGGSQLTGFFVNRNTSGTFLGIASLASLAWLLTAISWYERSRHRRTRSTRNARLNRQEASLAGISLLFCVLCLFLTLSRGAMIAWIMAFGTVTAVLAASAQGLLPQWTRGWGMKTRISILAIAALSVLLAVIEILGGPTTARLATGGADLARFCIYEAAFDGFRENWMFGTGLGTFVSAFQQYRPAECADIGLTIVRAHNTFLEALFCLGIFVLPVFVYVYSRLGHLFFRGYFIRKRLRHFAILGLGGLLLVTINSVVDFPLQIPGFAVYFACYLGAVASICLSAGRHRQQALPHETGGGQRRFIEYNRPRTSRMRLIMERGFPAWK